MMTSLLQSSSFDLGLSTLTVYYDFTSLVGRFSISQLSLINKCLLTINHNFIKLIIYLKREQQ